MPTFSGKISPFFRSKNLLKFKVTPREQTGNGKGYHAVLTAGGSRVSVEGSIKANAQTDVVSALQTQMRARGIAVRRKPEITLLPGRGNPRTTLEDVLTLYAHTVAMRPHVILKQQRVADAVLAKLVEMFDEIRRLDANNRCAPAAARTTFSPRRTMRDARFLRRLS